MTSNPFGFRSADLSPLRQRVQSGSIPSTPKEIAQIQEAIRSAEESLHYHIPAAIQHLKELVYLHKASIHPIQRLPNELLGEIFTYYTYDRTSLPCLNNGSPPTLLSCVSSKWRTIARTTPRLWTSFIVDFACVSARPNASILAHLQSHLQYSGSRVLDFQLAMSDNGRALYNLAIPLLVSHSTRWKSCILTNFTVEYQPLFTAVHGKLPLLERLYLGGRPGRTVLSSVWVFHHAPALIELYLAYFPLTKISLPWNRIQKIAFSASTYATFSPLSKEMTQLRSTYIAENESFGLELTSPEDSTFPTSVLSVTIRTLPLQITLPPKLATLSIGIGVNAVERHSCTRILELLDNSYLTHDRPCEIQTLNLSDDLSPTSHVELRSILCALPNLIQLTVSLASPLNRPLSFFGEGGHIFSLLLLVDDKDSIHPCPKLETLTIRNIRVSKWDMMFQLGRIISNRSEGDGGCVGHAAPLKSISLRFALPSFDEAGIEIVHGVPVEYRYTGIDSSVSPEWAWLSEVIPTIEWDEDEDL